MPFLSVIVEKSGFNPVCGVRRPMAAPAQHLRWVFLHGFLQVLHSSDEVTRQAVNLWRVTSFYGRCM